MVLASLKAVINGIHYQICTPHWLVGCFGEAIFKDGVIEGDAVRSWTVRYTVQRHYPQDTTEPWWHPYEHARLTSIGCSDWGGICLADLGDRSWGREKNSARAPLTRAEVATSCCNCRAHMQLFHWEFGSGIHTQQWHFWKGRCSENICWLDEIHWESDVEIRAYYVAWAALSGSASPSQGPGWQASTTTRE